MDNFTEADQRILSKFCTNTDKPIFALINLPEVVMGALFSRYSRSSKSLRRVLLDEFINNQESGFSDIVQTGKESGESQLVAIRKAEEFYERVLVGYGDDSVAELGGAHIACEDVSNIASKVLEDSRIGLSPLEKSTRYVYFNQKDANGKYSYYREPKIMQTPLAPEYESTCNLLFDTYSKLIEPMTAYFTERFPKDAQTTDRAYASAIRAKVCDNLRCLLPASAFTNVGIYGNGRAFEYLMLKMYSSDLAEIRLLASEMQSELSKVIPSFVKRANDRYGQPTQAYMKEVRGAIAKEADETGLNAKLQAEPNILPANSSMISVELVDFDTDAERKALAALLFPHSTLSLSEIYAKIDSMPQAEKEKLMLSYIGNRQNRRHRPGRAFENIHYTFSLLGNFGMYRDLHRHRQLTQERQLLTTLHGFEIPLELADAGYEEEVKECATAAHDTYAKLLAAGLKEESQYVVPMGFLVRWYVTLTLREAYHLIELRSMPQGHIDYRSMAQKMFLEIKKVHPLLASGMKFVDMSGSGLERLDSEKKIDAKLESLKQKYGK
jgi:thymidylate synthase ThyX